MEAIEVYREEKRKFDKHAMECKMAGKEVCVCVCVCVCLIFSFFPMHSCQFLHWHQNWLPRATQRYTHAHTLTHNLHVT